MAKSRNQALQIIRNSPFFSKIVAQLLTSRFINLRRKIQLHKIFKDSYLGSLQISIGWLYVVTSVTPLALKGILPIHIIPIGKIL